VAMATAVAVVMAAVAVPGRVAAAAVVGAAAAVREGRRVAERAAAAAAVVGPRAAAAERVAAWAAERAAICTRRSRGSWSCSRGKWTLRPVSCRHAARAYQTPNAHPETDAVRRRMVGGVALAPETGARG
jgi:hypothetical protein